MVVVTGGGRGIGAADIVRLFREAESALGALGGLVNHAGVTGAILPVSGGR